MTTYKYIKKLVEKHSNIENIGIKDRHEFIRDCRYAYMKLCYLYINNFSLNMCAKNVGKKSHVTVINGLTMFDRHYKTNNFKANEIYYICNIKLHAEKVKFIEKNAEDKLVYINELIESYINLKDSYIKELNVNYETIK